jgi:hypothetical protein
MLKFCRLIKIKGARLPILVLGYPDSYAQLDGSIRRGTPSRKGPDKHPTPKQKKTQLSKQYYMQEKYSKLAAQRDNAD